MAVKIGRAKSTRATATSGDAKKFFVDREIQRDAFKKSLNDVSAEGSSLLFYAGAGGVGKTALFAELGKLLSTTTAGLKFKHVEYDFASGAEMMTTLNALKKSLSKKYNVTFPLFEKGFLNYCIMRGDMISSEQIKSVLNNSSALRKMINQVESAEEKSGKLQELIASFNGFFGDATDTLDDLTNASMVLKLAKNGIKLLDNILTKRAQKAKEENDTDYADISQDLRKRIESQQAESVKELLPELFARDLYDWLEETDSSLIIFLDTYETLTEDEKNIKRHEKLVYGEERDVPLDWWVEELISYTSRVLWVIAGRSEVKTIGKEIPVPKGEGLFPLNALENKFADEFLLKSGIEDSDLREGLVKLTGGYPNFLNACVETYQNITKTGNVPRISDFGTKREDTITRLLRYMDEGASQMVRRLAILGMWTDTVAAKILSNLNEYNAQTYIRVKKLSFISAQSEKVFAFDRSIQKILLDHCRETSEFSMLLPQTRDAANTFFRSVFESDDADKINQYFRFWYEIILRTTAATDLMTQYKENLAPITSHFDDSVIETVLNEFCGNVKDELGTENISYGYFEHLLAKIKLRQDKIKDALELAEYAYRKFEDNHSVEKISVIDTLADVYEALKRTADEINLRGQAVTESEKLFHDKADEHIITAKEKLADALKYGDKKNKALEVREEIFNTLERFNDERAIEATANYADALEDVSKYNQALPLREKVVEFYRRTTDIEKLADTIENLTRLFRNFSTNEYREQKLNYQREFVTLIEKINGEYSYEVARAVDYVADTLKELGRHDEAAKEYYDLETKIRARLETLDDDEARVDLMEILENILSWSNKPEEEAKISAQIREIIPKIVEEKTREPIEDYDAVIDVLNKLSTKLSSLNSDDYQQDVELKRKILELTENKPDATDDDIINAMDDLVFTLSYNTEGYDEALEIREEIVERLKKKYPDNEAHEEIIDALDNVAGLLEYDIEDYVKALNKREEILSLLKESNADAKKILDAMENIADIYDWRLSNYPEALKWRKDILKFCQENFLPDAPEVIDAMEHLANVYENLQDYDEAEKLRTEIATLKGTKRGEDSNSDVISAKEKVAERLHDAGKYDEEVEIRKELVELYRKNYADNTDLNSWWDGVTSTMDDLARLLEDLGRNKEARAVRKDIVQEHTDRHAAIAQELGESSDDAISKMGDIADALRDVENFDEEFTYRKKIFKLRRAVDPNSDETILALDNLADFFRDHDKEDDAFKTREQIAAIRKNILEKFISVYTKDNDETIRAMENLSRAEEDLNHNEEGMYWREEMFAAKRRIAEKRDSELGKNHSQSIDAWDNLARELNWIDRYDAALIIYRDLLARLKEIYPDDNEEILDQMDNIRLALGRQNNYPAALNVLQEILQIRCAEKNGELSDKTLSTADDIARTFDDLDDYISVWQVRHEIVELYRQKFASDECNDEIIRAIDYEADALNRLEDYAAELFLRLKIVNLYAKKYGENGYNHADTIDAMKNVVRVLVEMKNSAQAITERENIVELLKGKYNEKHENVRDAMDDLAELLEEAGDLEGAFNQRMAIYNICEKNFGVDNEEFTIPAMDNLADILEKQENYSEALTWRRKIVDTLAGNYDVDSAKRRWWFSSTDISTAIYAFASTLESLGRDDEAETERGHVVDEIQNQLNKTIEAYGENSDKTVEKLEALVDALSRVDRRDDEIKNLERLVNILTQFKGKRAEKTLDVMDDLARLYEQYDLEDKAREVREDIAKIQREILTSRLEQFGNEHTRMIDIREKLARTLEQLDRTDEAATLREENLQARDKIVNRRKERFTDAHEITLDAMRELADNLEELRRYGDAEKIRREIVEIYEEKFADDKTNLKIIESLESLVSVLRDNDDYDAAIVEQKKLVDLLKEKYKGFEFCGYVIDALEKLADIYESAENFDAAIEIGREIVDWLKVRYGGNANHSYIVNVEEEIARLIEEKESYLASDDEEELEDFDEELEDDSDVDDELEVEEEFEEEVEVDVEDFEIDASNSVILRKGQKFDLTKNKPQLSSLKIIFGWDAANELTIDHSAYLLGGNGKVRTDEDLVFYNNAMHESGGVEYVEVPAQLNINLDKIPDDVAKIDFTLTIYDAETNEQNFSQVEGAYIAVIDVEGRAELLRFDLSQNFSVETAIIVGEIYRYKGDWKFNAIGAGFSGGLEALCANFGVTVE